MGLKRFDPAKFTTTEAKPLPVFLLLDVSGSMNEVMGNEYETTGESIIEDGQKWEVVSGGSTRIEILNQAVLEMIDTFTKEERSKQAFLVTVVTFGGAARVHLAPAKASSIAWKPLTAGGDTPLGEAIRLTKRMIEDKEVTPSRAYRPVVILVSDGRPNDAWEAPLAQFTQEGRSAKCDRIALAIGAETDEAMLRKFVAGTLNPLFHAADAAKLLEMFRRVTMSVTVRSQSKDPNQAPSIASLDEPLLNGPGDGVTGSQTNTDPDDGYW